MTCPIQPAVVLFDEVDSAVAYKSLQGHRPFWQRQRHWQPHALAGFKALPYLIRPRQGWQE